MLSLLVPLLLPLLSLPVTLADPLPPNFDNPFIFNPPGATNSTIYAFGPTGQNHDKVKNIQLAVSDNNGTAWTVLDADALPDAGPWTLKSDPHVRSPYVSQRPDGSFLLYYSALSATPNPAPAPKPGVSPPEPLHCISTALSPSLLGPYIPSPRPFFCPIIPPAPTSGSPPNVIATDPSPFADTDGTPYVVVAIHTTTAASRSLCDVAATPGSVVTPTQILLLQVQTDGMTLAPDSSPHQLLEGGEIDRTGLVSLPRLKAVEGGYELAYRRCRDGKEQDGVAISEQLFGPYRAKDGSRKLGRQRRRSLRVAGRQVGCDSFD